MSSGCGSALVGRQAPAPRTTRRSSPGWGNCPATVWYNDEHELKGIDDDFGGAIGIDQEVGDRLVLSALYGWSGGDATIADHALSGAFGIDGVADRDDDLFGVAVGRLSPCVGSGDQGFVTEVPGRLQLTRVQELSIGIQAMLNPSFTQEDETVGLSEARWRVAF